MLFENQTASLEERWCDEFRRCGAPEAILACTYTFNAEYFSEILELLSEAVVMNGDHDRFSLHRIPINVVCDRKKYRGHKVGYNVAYWQNPARLFHPKLLIVLFQNEVVWSDGSLNLTKPGWRSNREVAMLHRPGNSQLPKAVRELLVALPGNNKAAKLILSSTKNAPSNVLVGKCVSSLYEPIGPQFISKMPSCNYADEVHLVAPFFDDTMAESSDAVIDSAWFSHLAKKYPDADYHVYLPQLSVDPVMVQGDRRLFLSIQRMLSNRIQYHAVERKPGPLHGKIVNIVYRKSRTDRACMLIGSPNLTHAALMAPVSRGNVEMAWIVDKPWKDVKPLFKSIQSKSLKYEELIFVKPTIKSASLWQPLKQAIYDPLQRTLKLEWIRPEESIKTALRYAGNYIKVMNDEVKPFDLVDGLCSLTMHNIADKRSGLFPIEIPPEDLPACGPVTTERTPDDWLKLLGILNADIRRQFEGGQHKSSNTTTTTIGYEWSSRVRDLSARMRYVADVLSDERASEIDEKRNINLLKKIFAEHDPMHAESVTEKVWRVWVRLELWRLAMQMSGSLSKTKRLRWQAITSKWKYGLGVKQLPLPIQKQVQAVRKALESAS